MRRSTVLLLALGILLISQGVLGKFQGGEITDDELTKLLKEEEERERAEADAPAKPINWDAGVVNVEEVLEQTQRQTQMAFANLKPRSDGQEWTKKQTDILAMQWQEVCLSQNILRCHFHKWTDG